MNIFYLDKDPIIATKYMYNKHIVKMILESAQMLCTAHHHFGNGDKVPYRKAHYNHPSTKWVRENTLHYKWLYNHMLALGYQYTKKYNKIHQTIVKCTMPLINPPVGMPTKEFVQPPQCMPDQYKDKCSVKAYWNYYEQDKKRIATKSEKIITRPIFY